MALSLKQLTHLFRALSHPTRLRIVNLLHGQSLCVGELQEVLGLSQPFISRHLAILRAANLVRGRRQGPRVCYSMACAPFLNYPLRQFFREVAPFCPELQADVQNLQEPKGNSMRKSEASSSPLDAERPAPGLRKDANEGEKMGPALDSAQQAEGEESHG